MQNKAASPNLRSRSLQGMLWNAIELISLRSFGLLVVVLVTRRLEPGDYGLVGMLAILSAFADVVVNSGLTLALVRRSEVSNEELSSVFIFQVTTATVLYGLLFVCAPWVAQFYKRPELVLLSRIAFLSIIINSFYSVQMALITRETKFKFRAQVNMCAALFSGGVALICVYGECGYWSLVCQNLSSQLVMALAFFLWGRWRPSLCFNWQAFWGLFCYGWKLSITMITNTIALNLCGMILGKSYSAKALGFYSQADKMQNISNNILSSVITNTSLPVLSSLQENHVAFDRAYRRFVTMTAYLVSLVSFLLIAIAPPLFRLLFTAKWDGAVLYFQLLSFIGFGYAMRGVLFNSIIVRGKGTLHLILGSTKDILEISLLLFTSRMGIMPMLLGMCVNMLFSTGLAAYFGGRLAHYSMKHIGLDLLRILVNSSIPALAAWGVMNFLSHPLQQVLLQGAVWLVVFLTISHILRNEYYMELRVLLLSKFIKMKVKLYG